MTDSRLTACRESMYKLPGRDLRGLGDPATLLPVTDPRGLVTDGELLTLPRLLVLLRRGEPNEPASLIPSSSSSSSAISPSSSTPCAPTCATWPIALPQLLRLLGGMTLPEAVVPAKPSPIIGLDKPTDDGADDPAGAVERYPGLRGAASNSPGASSPSEIISLGAASRPSSASSADCRVSSGLREPSSVSRRPRSFSAARTWWGSFDQLDEAETEAEGKGLDEGETLEASAKDEMAGRRRDASLSVPFETMSSDSRKLETDEWRACREPRRAC